MACVLRVSGTFHPKRLLDHCRWTTATVWRRGELRGLRREAKTSGFSVVVSEAGFAKFPKQVNDATAFLKKYAAEFAWLRTVGGVRDVTLDFGVARRDVPAWFLVLPIELVELAGRNQVSIELSLYAVSGHGGIA